MSRPEVVIIDRGVRAIALFEAFKGGLVLVVGLGLVSLVHRNIEGLAIQLMRYLQIDPTRHYPQELLAAASHVDASRLYLLAALAFGYALLRFVEAWGLWRMRVWGEWLGILSGAIYLPFELYEIFQGVTWLKVAVLLVNAAVVVYLVKVRLDSHKLPRGIIVGPDA